MDVSLFARPYILGSSRIFTGALPCQAQRAFICM